MVWVVRKAKAQKAADMMERDVFMGSSGKGSNGLHHSQHRDGAHGPEGEAGRRLSRVA